MANSIKHFLDKLYAGYVIVGAKSIIFLSLALIIATITIYLSNSWILKTISQDTQIRDIRTIIVDLTQFKSNLYQAESAQRGYIITQKLYYLQFYKQAIQGARSNISELEKFILSMDGVKSPDQKLIESFKVTLEAKVTEMNITIDLVKSGQTDMAINVTRLDKGLYQANKINLLMDSVLNYYDKLLKEAFNERTKTREIAQKAVFIVPLFIMLLVSMVIRQLLLELANKNKTQLALSEINIINQQRLDEQRNMLSELALSNLADVERERRHIARELHDELGSILTATKMDLSWVIKALKDSQPLVVDKLKNTSRYIDKGISFKRELVQSLHPPMISSFGFWPALKNMIDDAAERNEWEFELVLPPDDVVLDETIALVAYRVIQETLNNCSKYAKAKKVSVFVICDSINLKIEIQDDGVGFDVSNLQTSTRHGIKGMSHRVQGIGGVFTITSSADGGVNSLIIIPLKNYKG
ncbi:MAG: CHASE3 domain-containing protein [Methylotenera sp.]|uniref:sensor histidine kinase n=1 Tax=Methylotenera sp. TaxID=2051956 RepID=UPI002489D2ED|nr:CHASE3 domain-containing protein [Methylotenera sp.]MDI1310502.1 CHASE3 domain-containing protein [Methylotenera sp.]